MPAIPVAPQSLLDDLRDIRDGGGKHAGWRDPASLRTFLRVSGGAKRYLRLIDAGWVEHRAAKPVLTPAGERALALAELGLRGLTSAQAFALVGVAEGRVTDYNGALYVTGKNRWLARSASGRATGALKLAWPALERYGLAHPMTEDTPRLTEKGEQAAKLLTDLIAA